jgi:tRNA C32,U32 (ribose-2'-O)-methylase TrmJ
MNVGAEARAMQNSETYEEWVTRQLVERDALAARLAQATALLRRVQCDHEPDSWIDDIDFFLGTPDRGSET